MQLELESGEQKQKDGCSISPGYLFHDFMPNIESPMRSFSRRLTMFSLGYTSASVWIAALGRHVIGPRFFTDRPRDFCPSRHLRYEQITPYYRGTWAKSILQMMVPEFARFSLTVDGVSVSIATVQAPGDSNLTPIVCLHGFGSTKEDYYDIAHYPDLQQRPFLAYDAPGCGESNCADLSRISIPFLVRTAEAVLDRAGVAACHLIGHSMGGLTALYLAKRAPDRVRSFVNIEGNLAPEDCFLSRQIVSHGGDHDPEEFFDRFVERTRRAPAYSNALYAASLRHKVRAGAVPGIFTSMVQLSDEEDLMGVFLGLPFPRMFIYGELNSGLSYLPRLQENGVELAEIPYCGHFPMYSNPPAMYGRLEEFYKHMS